MLQCRALGPPFQALREIRGLARDAGGEVAAHRQAGDDHLARVHAAAHGDVERGPVGQSGFSPALRRTRREDRAQRSLQGTGRVRIGLIGHVLEQRDHGHGIRTHDPAAAREDRFAGVGGELAHEAIQHAGVERAGQGNEIADGHHQDGGLLGFQQRARGSPSRRGAWSRRLRAPALLAGCGRNEWISQPSMDRFQQQLSGKRLGHHALAARWPAPAKAPPCPCPAPGTGSGSAPSGRWSGSPLPARRRSCPPGWSRSSPARAAPRAAPPARDVRRRRAPR